MLSWKSRASGRKGLSRARLFVVTETLICGAFFRDDVLSRGICLQCWGDALLARYCPSQFPMSVERQVTLAPVVSRSWGRRSHWGLLGKKARLTLGRSCCNEEEGQSRAGPLQSCALPTHGHRDGVSLGQCHCRRRRRAKNIQCSYTQLFLLQPVKTGFCGYE